MNGRFLVVAINRQSGSHQLFHTTSLPGEQCAAVVQSMPQGACIMVLKTHDDLGEDAPQPPTRPTFAVVQP